MEELGSDNAVGFVNTAEKVPPDNTGKCVPAYGRAERHEFIKRIQIMSIYNTKNF